MINNYQVCAVKYLTPLFGIVCGLVTSAIFFALLLGGAVLGAKVFSPLLALPFLLAAAIYSFRSWLVLLHENKLFGWGIFLGFIVGVAIISFLILLAVTVMISPA